MKIGPDVWGPHGWKFIHMIALAYPLTPTAEQKLHYREFFTVLQYILPCSICANNYAKHFTEDLPFNDEVLANRDNLVKWTIDVHNLVNKENGKKPIPYEEALQLIYNNFEENNIKMETTIPIKPIQMVPYADNVNAHLPAVPDKVEFKKVQPKVLSPKEENSTFGSFSFWLLIFIALVTIAIVYKKGN